MISKKRFILSAFASMFLLCSYASAQTCYDPYYGYYNCGPSYIYYPDQGQAVMEGLVAGMLIGTFASGGFDRGHDHRGGWNHGGGHQGGWHGGGHHH